MTIGRGAAHWGAFRAEVVDGIVRKVAPFERDRSPSPLIQSVPEAVHADNRIRTPCVREGYLRDGPGRTTRRGAEPFVRIGWDEALDLVERELRRVCDTSGNSAIFGGSYGWASAGRVSHARTLLHRFLNLIGGCVGQVTNYSWGAAEVLLKHIVGDRDLVSGPVTDWRSIARHTDLMVMFGGANPKNAHVTSGGGGSHDYVPWLSACREAGTKFVVISPIRTDAPPEMAAEWVPIRPNADTVMILALAYVIETEGLADRAFLASHTNGYDRFRAYLLGETDGIPKTPDWAAALSTVPAATIADLARRMAAGRTMLSATWSLQRAEYGEQPYWALVTLAAMMGQIGLPGGGFGFGYGSINGLGNPRQSIRVPAMESGRNPLGLAIPVARISDLLLCPGESIAFDGRRITFPDIRLVYWAGGNPFHHHQDINRLLAAWQRPETIIVHEPWWTPTARHADIVLPATTAMEREDIAASSRDRFILAMHRLVPPQHEARNDFDIFADLAARFGQREAYTEGRDLGEWTRHLYERARANAAEDGVDLPPFEAFWQQGYAEVPLPDEDHVALTDFRRDPEKHPLKTASGRIEIFSETIAGFGYADCPGHATWFAPREWLGAEQARRFPLHLITSQPATRLHSQLDGVGVSAADKVDGRERAWMSPADAAKRSLREGDAIRLHNDRGACLAALHISDAVMPGVIQLATGAWYDPETPGQPGTLDKHGNPNMLTRDIGTSQLAQGPAAMSVLVEVTRAIDPPPVTAHLSPIILEEPR